MWRLSYRGKISGHVYMYDWPNFEDCIFHLDEVIKRSVGGARLFDSCSIRKVSETK